MPDWTSLDGWGNTWDKLKDGDVGGAIKQGLMTSADPAGLVLDTAGNGDGPQRDPQLSQTLGTPYEYNPAAFDARDSAPFRDAQSRALNFNDSLREQYYSEDELNAGAVGGARPAQSYTTPTVTAGTVGPAGTSRVDAASAVAHEMLANSGHARGTQTDNLAYIDQVRRGEGPSVGRTMAERAGVTAANDYRVNANTAGTAYGTAHNTATGAYGSATLEQMIGNELAARDAGRRLDENVEAGRLAQASMSAGARGSNIGLTMLAGQNNAALSQQNAARQQAELMSDAFQANINTAGRAAQNAYTANNAANIQTFGAENEANIRATAAMQDAMYQGAEITSAEQLDAMRQYTEANNVRRAQDFTGAGAATSLAGVGLGADTYVTDSAHRDVDRTFAADTANQNARLTTNDLNQTSWRDYLNDEITRDLANQDNRAGNAQRLQDGTIATQEQLAQMAMFGVSSLQDLEAAQAAAYANAMAARGNYETGLMNVEIAEAQRRAQERGALIGAAGTVGGAVAGGPAGAAAGGAVGRRVGGA